ncbi:energy transducer TonB [Balneolaceae bacterium ANBcel3]|nr:energy transducer TonB [Balneolaceae bacterium ANBcel3]
MRPLIHRPGLPYKGNRLYSMSVMVLTLALFMISTPYTTYGFQTEAEDEVFRIVDEMPEIVGGIEALYGHLQYPDRAVREGIEGRVVVQFIVESDGSIRDPEVLRDIGGGCGEAAVQAIRRVEFTPGRQDGQAVPVIYALPITFRLN